ncbi:MAG: peptidylprolyl isomerase [Vicinamibacterales bacterium]
MLLRLVSVVALVSQVVLPSRPRVVSEPGITGSAQGAAVLAAEDSRAPTPADISILVQSAGSSNRQIQIAAIRALGRLERRDVVTDLLKYLRPTAAPAVRAEAASAIAQAMRGERSQLDPNGTQTEVVLLALLAAASREKDAAPLGEIARSLARLPFESAEQLLRVDAMLVQILTLSHELDYLRKEPGEALPAIRGAVAGAELRGRLHTRLAPASEELTATIRHLATDRTTLPPKERPPLQESFAALVQVRGVEEDSLRVSLDSPNDSVRRLAAASLAEGASPITGADRAGHLRRLLNDRSQLVRYEALRGYARSHARTDGCGPVLAALSDKSLHVALAAIDALGDVCKEDQGVVARLVGEARTPPNVGKWQRQAHAMVALAKLAREQAEVALASHSRHVVWQVRIYAARAAAALNDTATLERLAVDDNDNVREAALAPLRRIKGVASEPQMLVSFSRRDYQLLRTAATEIKGLPPSRAVTSALVEALKRVTAEKKETSRDARLAIVERLGEFGLTDHLPELLPLLKDFDAKVAAAVAKALTASTGTAYAADPQPLPRQPLPAVSETSYLMEFDPVLVMANGRDITLRLDVEHAPMAAVRFLRLARANYFDNLTFHRVVPNFVIQGGSPGANEYMGDGPYMRDEISTLSHVTGTLGISTRGRDTGDAQFFMNLVDNSRLDFEYTVFGAVAPSSLDEMFEVNEGDVIRDVKFVRRR